MVFGNTDPENQLDEDSDSKLFNELRKTNIKD